MVELLMDLDEVLTVLYSRSVDDFLFETDGVSRETINKYRSLRNKPTLDKLSKLTDKLQVSVDMGILLMFVNSENNKSITSNGKKIFNLLALADSGEVDPNGIFMSRRNRYPEAFCYLDKKCDVLNANNHFKEFYYLPGRSVSRRQIWALGERFGYDKYKINMALDNLLENGLVKLTLRGEKPNKAGRSETDLFNLSAEGCADYVREAQKKVSCP